MPEPRQIIVVDVETTGLDPATHRAIEVAWLNLSTGESGAFIPPHSPGEVLAEASVEALRVNRYIDRIPGQQQDHGGQGAYQLAEQLHGNTLAGATPSFDAAFLTRMYEWYDDRELSNAPQWHHRLLDLSAYAAGVLGIPPTELPGLSDVCERLGVANWAPHTAGGDVHATAECFRQLAARAVAS